MKLVRIILAPALAVVLTSGALAQPSDWIVDPELPRPGDLFRVSLRLPAGVKTGTFEFKGHTVPGFETGGLLNGYLGVDLDIDPGKHQVGYAMGAEEGTVSVLIAEREFPSETVTTESAPGDVDAATQTRVEREAAVLAALWNQASVPRHWVKGFVQPAGGTLGSTFGVRRISTGAPRPQHAGQDIVAPVGGEVFAANAGKIVLAEELFLTGNTLVIDHGIGMYTLYAYLSRLDVSTGSIVQRAERVGAIGGTGLATEPHLHWAAVVGGVYVDPMMLPGMPLR
ncbi:MAG: M23 family metallopeptidase [Myxococcales bacterium]|nr:MAG: M23 family metallopeptidase [Myxococcales bacterium]